MTYREQIGVMICNILENTPDMKDTILEDYKELNKKCDTVITKIKTRKKKKKAKDGRKT